eukprot:comp18148_c0_seq1/m.31917 comp18148_c0_seq1/g.31917  ORF comp18148_c0_seq1/g.31917 comp18148_c0_seq1/m.31917 type:complete len:344 (-) comp18148_c0_seq1:177-1208(-)
MCGAVPRGRLARPRLADSHQGRGGADGVLDDGARSHARGADCAVRTQLLSGPPLPRARGAALWLALCCDACALRGISERPHQGDRQSAACGAGCAVSCCARVSGPSHIPHLPDDAQSVPPRRSRARHQAELPAHVCLQAAAQCEQESFPDQGARAADHRVSCGAEKGRIHHEHHGLGPLVLRHQGGWICALLYACCRACGNPGDLYQSARRHVYPLAVAARKEKSSRVELNQENRRRCGCIAQNSHGLLPASVLVHLCVHRHLLWTQLSAVDQSLAHHHFVARLFVHWRGAHRARTAGLSQAAPAARAAASVVPPRPGPAFVDAHQSAGADPQVCARHGHAQG